MRLLAELRRIRSRFRPRRTVSESASEGSDGRFVGRAGLAERHRRHPESMVLLEVRRGRDPAPDVLFGHLDEERMQVEEFVLSHIRNM